MTIFDPSNPKHARALERLGSEIVIWLTTVSPKGQPQTSPVWFLWDGEVFHLVSQPETPKVHNLRANPRVSLHLQSSEDAESDVVIFEGLAELQPGAHQVDGFTPYIDKYRKWIDSFGWTPESMLADYSVGLRITPTRIRVEED